MAAMNRRMNLPALANIMKEFEKQNAKMDQVEEMMGDALDDAFEVPPPASVFTAWPFSSLFLTTKGFPRCQFMARPRRSSYAGRATQAQVHRPHCAVSVAVLLELAELAKPVEGPCRCCDTASQAQVHRPHCAGG